MHSFGIALFGYDYKNINIEHLFSTSNLNEYAQNICNYMKIHKNENLNYFQLIEKSGMFLKIYMLCEYLDLYLKGKNVMKTILNVSTLPQIDVIWDVFINNLFFKMQKIGRDHN